LAFGVWRLAFGAWRLALGVWRLAFGAMAPVVDSAYEIPLRKLRRNERTTPNAERQAPNG
jgi:hypothetical protein